MGGCFSVQISGGDSLINQCWICVAPRFMYVWQLSYNLQQLAIEREHLLALKTDVMRRVINEEGPQTKRLDRVQNWLSNVEAKLAKVDQVITNGEEEKKKLRCGGYCSKECYSTYNFGKMVVKTLSEVIVLKQDGNFEEVVGRTPPEAVIERPSDPTVGLQSNSEKVWKFLMEEEVGVIGIYGMGGVGKTTLLTEINNSFLNSAPIFDFVIWVVVSKDSKLEMLQEQIAKRIGLSNDPLWREKTVDEKAEFIFKVLQKKKFTLFLDDLWDRVELQRIGIPLPNRENKCKLVFTTRSEVVCGEMEAQRRIKLEPLAWEEAWQLFQDKVGREALDADPNIPRVSEDLARECAGLPLALIVVGRTMACKKTIQEWNHAVEIMRLSASTFKGMEDKVFPILKFSYDSLPNEKFKSCLLYCTLFPEDFEIPKEELIEKWVCESFWDKGNNQIDAMNEGYNIVATLVHVCLLEDKGEWVKMHDVIRDMCLWIACEVEKEKENYFVQASCLLKKAPDVRKWLEVRRVSLMQNKIQELTEVPESPHLLTLFLSRNIKLEMIKDGFFQYMKALTVLDLSRTKLRVLPTGIGELVSLQYLDISDTDIQTLSWELTELKKLKCFYLESTWKLQEIPRQLMTSFPLLQILGMRGCSFDLDKSTVEELGSLEDLKELRITVRSNPSVLHHLLTSPKLSWCIRYLDVRDLGSWLSEKDQDTVRKTSPCGELAEEKKQTLGGLQKSLRKGCFASLRKGEFYSCIYLQELTWLILAPNLMHLIVIKCRNLKEIVSYGKLGEVVEDDQYENPDALSSLQVLELADLPHLQSICWKPMLFPSLDKISIIVCPMLKKLPLNSNSAKGRNLVIHGNKDWWDRLDWEDDSTLPAFTSCFRDFGYRS